jgi:hypothetical protein
MVDLRWRDPSIMVGPQENDTREKSSVINVARSVLEVGCLNGPFYLTATLEVWVRPMGSFGAGVLLEELF